MIIVRIINQNGVMNKILISFLFYSATGNAGCFSDQKAPTHSTKVRQIGVGKNHNLPDFHKHLSPEYQTELRVQLLNRDIQNKKARKQLRKQVRKRVRWSTQLYDLIVSLRPRSTSKG